MNRLSPKQIRVFIGSALLLVAGGLFWVDWFYETRVAVSSVITLFGLAGFLEYAKLTSLSRRESGGGRLVAAWGFILSAYFLALAWWVGIRGDPLSAEYYAGGLAGLLLGVFLLTLFRTDFLESFPPLLATLFGVILFGWLYSYVLRIYHLDSPKAGLVRGLVFFFGVKGTDISAYLVGSAIGRHHFLKISPGKTIEGSVAALIFGGVWFCGAALIFPEYFFSWPLWSLFGIILAVTSALGDLLESLVKRFYRVKDSGSLLPEFGGVLDMIDSLVFSAFVFWCFLQIGAGGPWN